MNYRTCLGCDRPMRTSKQPAKEHPGTVVHKYQGRCATCRNAERREPDYQTDPEQVARTAAELAGYLAWRRPYRQGVNA